MLMDTRNVSMAYLFRYSETFNNRISKGIRQIHETLVRLVLGCPSKDFISSSTYSVLALNFALQSHEMYIKNEKWLIKFAVGRGSYKSAIVMSIFNECPPK